MVLITIVNGVYKATYNWGAPSCNVAIQISLPLETMVDVGPITHVWEHRMGLFAIGRMGLPRHTTRHDWKMEIIHEQSQASQDTLWNIWLIDIERLNYGHSPTWNVWSTTFGTSCRQPPARAQRAASLKCWVIVGGLPVLSIISVHGDRHRC